MLFTAHLMAGAAWGAASRRPVLAAAVGPASHLLMDSLPHTGVPGEHFLALASLDGTLGVALLAHLWRVTPPGRTRRAMIAGAFGAGLLDLDKPARILAGFELWPASVTRVHHAVQAGVESSAHWPVDLSVIAVGLGAALVLAGRTRTRVAAAS